jgi:hypothetical protein
MPTLPPILVADLFPEVTSRLVALLRSLSPDEWQRATVSSRRTVKDIASHLLDGSLRRLSMQRDGYRPAGEPLVGFLNGSTTSGKPALDASARWYWSI